MQGQGNKAPFSNACLYLAGSSKHSCGLTATRWQSTTALKTRNGGFDWNYAHLKRDKNALFIFPKPCPSPTKLFLLGQAVSGNIFWLKTFAEFQESAPQILRLLC